MSVILFVLVYGFFAACTPEFRRPETFTTILVQTSSLAIVAAGMTFVMLTAGIDLSVGAVMFLGAAIAGKLVLAASVPIPVAILAMLAVGLIWGWGIGTLVTRFRIAPFIVTLAALFVGRGLGLDMTETRAMNLPDDFREIATGSVLGLPVPALLSLAVVAAGQIVLSATPFGRYVFAVGEDETQARKAGLPVSGVLLGAYVICSFCATLGGVVSLAELSAVSPKFGEGEEFNAIAAAVLGGTSLFGGRGSIVPGTLVGALLMQTIRTGLNVLNVDPYIYPIVTSLTIFVAVWIDSARQSHLERMSRRRIRPD